MSLRARAVRPDLSVVANIVSRTIEAGEKPHFGLDLFPGLDFEAETLTAERRASGGMTIIARLSDVEMGTAVLTVEAGVLTANIHSLAGSFVVTPQPDGSYRVAEIDHSQFPREAAPLTPPATSLPFSAAPDAAAADVPVDSGRLIDVMVVWTSAAQTAAGGAGAIASLAQNSVDTTNAAYLNSGIAQRLRLVYSGSVAYTETTACGFDRATCALNTITTDATVANLRNTHGADLVSLLIAREASIFGTSGSSNNCGHSWLLTSAAGDIAHAFSVVGQDCAVENLSFPHELAHNMGANDDPYSLGYSASCSDLKAPGVYCYSRGYVKLIGIGLDWRTIMGYDNQCVALHYTTCPRVPYFSNPNVSVINGGPTGTAGSNNNALTLNNTAKVVAAYRATSGLHPIAPLYADVPQGSTFFGYVQSVAQAQYTGGCAAGMYCPGNYVTRGQMAAFLERVKHSAIYNPVAVGNVFTDVPAGAQFAGFIEALKADGITSGCTATAYCPNDPVQRDQMAKFILKAKCGSAYVPALRVSTFSDVPTGSTFANYVMKLSSLGITSGCTATTFCPTGYVTRAAMAKFLERSISFGYPTEACTP